MKAYTTIRVSSRPKVLEGLQASDRFIYRDHDHRNRANKRRIRRALKRSDRLHIRAEILQEVTL